ncbi:TPA: hypothetical protein ACJKZ7_003979, partial [Acinetobacter baumannii]
MACLSIQTLNMRTDVDGYAFEANKKINFNLKQLNNDIELLPENIQDLDENNLSILKYLRQISEA